MHEPNPIDVAARQSGEPVFREVGVGPWEQQHPGVPRPSDPTYDPVLLDEGDRRNVLDRYRYWTVEAIKADLDAQGRHGFEVAIENWTHDFNIGSMVRTANAFTANTVHIVGPHKWNRKGALMTELYQHIEHHPSIQDLVDDWHRRIEQETCDATQRVAAATQALDQGTVPTMQAQQDLAQATHDLEAAQQARIIAMDIVPGAVPLERYEFPERCLMLFGAEGPGLSSKALDLADDVVYISQFGSVRSINAGAAAAVSMHAWIAQHAQIAACAQ
ncbi:TrmH family RNA methyltransferase [Bifidobacterium gallicum]|uniref:RNA methyltransferase n=1 Tax=Bifidobacterium gallicum DSM 20093 = LMG 11596 TaxID=561180 RepID=D1NWY8_9BIFI|nr:TrmH family RNA methyltransferase [Bifidobacterium gallicum]EFA22119.1 RNA methyltransferase, TrmH family [Bifidobacterium gallicum DSM 20093 = LMG 11596]KFI59019.1 RNA methyltransferase [Bifidobacterium gallicum DSM 20093 = LMG 11596]